MPNVWSLEEDTISWKWGHRPLWAAMMTLGNEPKSSVRAAILLLNHLSNPRIYTFLKESMRYFLWYRKESRPFQRYPRSREWHLWLKNISTTKYLKEIDCKFVSFFLTGRAHTDVDLALLPGFWWWAENPGGKQPYLSSSPFPDVPAIILLHRLGRKTAGIFT